MPHKMRIYQIHMAAQEMAECALILDNDFRIHGESVDGHYNAAKLQREFARLKSLMAELFPDEKKAPK